RGGRQQRRRVRRGGLRGVEHGSLERERGRVGVVGPAAGGRERDDAARAPACGELERDVAAERVAYQVRGRETGGVQRALDLVGERGVGDLLERRAAGVAGERR